MTRSAPAAELGQRLADEAFDRPQLRLRLCGAELEPREVEQVRDQPVESLRFHVDRREQARAVGFAQLEGRVLEPVRCSADRGQRRAKVVADGSEDRGLDRVAPAEGLRFDGSPPEPLAVDRDG